MATGKDQSVTFTIENVVPVTAKLRSILDSGIQTAAAALHAEHELIMTTAKRLTPVDTGALRASGYVRQPMIRNNEVISQGGFGGSSAPYAIYVHERLDVRHPIGQAKFYESAIMEGLHGMDERLSKRIKATL